MKRFLTDIVVLIVIAAIVLAGGYFYVRKTCGLDLFVAAGHIKALSERTDTKKSFPLSYGEEDLPEAVEGVNRCGVGLIATAEDGGYEFVSAPSGIMSRAVILTEKQTAAFLSLLIGNSEESLSVGGTKIPAEIVEVRFAEVSKENGATVSYTIKIDTAPLKTRMNVFPSSLIKPFFPDELYLTSVVEIKKEAEPFSYLAETRELSINGLSAEYTRKILDDIGSFVKIGSAEDAGAVGIFLTNLLLGGEESQGFAYSLRIYGAKNFVFDDVSFGAQHGKIFAVVV